MTPAPRPDILRQAWALVRSGRPGPELWLLAFFVLMATTMAELYAVPDGPDGRWAFAAVAIVRVVLVIWTLSVLIRGTADRPPLLRPTWALARLGGLYLLIGVVLPGLVTGLAARLAGDVPALADRWLILFVAGLAYQLLVIRSLAWLAALGVGDPLGPKRSWTGLRRATLPLIRAFLVLVAPFTAIHLALSLMFVDGWVPDSGAGLLAMIVVDSAASTAQLVMYAVLAVLAWAVARERTATA